MSTTDKIKMYYEDIGILYHFTSKIGDGYCIKRWARGIEPTQEKIDEYIRENNFTLAFWSYLDYNFHDNIDFLNKKKEIINKIRSISTNYDDYISVIHELSIKRTLVEDEAVLVKFALLENKLSSKTNIFIQLEKLKRKINDDECDLDKITSLLNSALEA